MKSDYYEERIAKKQDKQASSKIMMRKQKIEEKIFSDKSRQQAND
jgi:hypothetical protein